MKNNLLLSLGHNSSAIFIDSETKEVTAYEQERLDKKMVYYIHLIINN